MTLGLSVRVEFVFCLSLCRATRCASSCCHVNSDAHGQSGGRSSNVATFIILVLSKIPFSARVWCFLTLQTNLKHSLKLLVQVCVASVPLSYLSVLLCSLLDNIWSFHLNWAGLIFTICVWLWEKRKSKGAKHKLFEGRSVH